MTSIPVSMTTQGPVPTSPTALNQALIAGVAALNPGYTATLPGSLIEDISSTDVGAMVTIDQARVDAINSVSPYLANAFVLAQLGAQFGIVQGLPTNANVYVVFTGQAGFVINPGFLVSDGTNQYSVTNGGVIGSSGQSLPIYAVATNSNTFAIPANTVTQIVSSVPSPYTLTVTNPTAGTTAQAAESVASYRSRVLLAGQVASVGTPAFVKTLLLAIPGVQPNLVSIQQATSGWRVICGGGDTYQVANALLQGIPDISALQGSQLSITAMTAANPVVITTNLDANLTVGSTFTVAGATPSAYNVTYTVASVASGGTVITTTTNGSSFGTYTGGATFSPNPRNLSASLFQNPDTYTITYVNPPQQDVTLTATWNTTLANFTAGQTVNQLASAALSSYINGLEVGTQINELAMTAAFQNAVASVLSPANLTTLEFTVEINGTVVPPAAGTSVIPSDPESYFYASSVTVVQG